MSAPATAATAMKKERRPPESFYVTCEVDIDVEDLEEAGYHHEDDCPAKPEPGFSPAEPVSEKAVDAIASLHRQAHPSQPLSPFTCAEEPCRSLPMVLTMVRIGRAS